jgi:hypothetical protein
LIREIHQMRMIRETITTIATRTITGLKLSLIRAAILAERPKSHWRVPLIRSISITGIKRRAGR